jgi:WD40 repeat protein
VIAFTADGENVLAHERHGGLEVWNVTERRCVRTVIPWRSQRAVITSGYAVSPRGDLVAANECLVNPRSYALRLWDTRTWEATVLNQVDTGSPHVLCFDPTGTRLATNVGTFDVATRTWLTRQAWLGEALKWSPTGQFLAGSYRNVLCVSDAESGKEVRTLQLEKKEVQDFAFSPDGNFLLAVSNEEIVRVWDVRDWSEREGFAWRIGELKCITFAPDGQRAACGSHDGTILIWDWDL